MEISELSSLEKNKVYKALKTTKHITDNDCFNEKELQNFIKDSVGYIKNNTKNIIDTCLNCEKDSCVIIKKTYGN